MDKLIELLLRQPIILFVIVVWIIGAVTNAAKASKKRRERQAKQPSPPVRKPEVTTMQNPQAQSRAPLSGPRSRPVGGKRTTLSPPPVVAQQPGGGRLANSSAQTPEQIAAEMRRILGLETQEPPRAEPVSRPPSPPIAKPPERARVGTSDRKLDIHVDPHVGERIRDRHMQKSKVGQPRQGRGALGSLGGRVTTKHRRAKGLGSRYSLDDLRKVIVMNEILSPPVSQRSFDERRPV